MHLSLFMHLAILPNLICSKFLLIIIHILKIRLLSTEMLSNFPKFTQLLSHDWNPVSLSASTLWYFLYIYHKFGINLFLIKTTLTLVFIRIPFLQVISNNILSQQGTFLKRLCIYVWTENVIFFFSKEDWI